MFDDSRKRICAVISLVIALHFGSCRNTTQPGPVNKGPGEVTVYVSTDRVFSEPILRDFEAATGVKVNAVYDTEETKSTGLASSGIPIEAASAARARGAVDGASQTMAPVVRRSSTASRRICRPSRGVFLIR